MSQNSKLNKKKFSKGHPINYNSSAEFQISLGRLFIHKNTNHRKIRMASVHNILSARAQRRIVAAYKKLGELDQQVYINTTYYCLYFYTNIYIFRLYEYFYDISKNSNKQNSLFNGSGLRHFEAETKYERKMSKLVVMTDYKKNDTMKAERANKKTNKVDDQSGQDTKIIEMNLNISNNIKNIWMDITIDGPYSTASRRIMDSEHAILIAGGIGVTPFASILQSLWFKYTKTLKTCSKCQHQWYDILEQKKIKKVDFIWVNRDYQSFEWFIELLGELEMQQLNLTSNESERFIDIHLYMTSASVVQEIKPLEYHMADKLEQMQNRNKNFSLKLNPGRPNFDDVSFFCAINFYFIKV